jgi:hypothetical protein
MIKPANLDTNDAFERLQRRSGKNPVQSIGPFRALSQIHRIVVSVGEAESNRRPPACLRTQRIDQLLAEKAHVRCTEDDDALLVQSDDPLIRPKVEPFREVQVPALRRVVAL